MMGNRANSEKKENKIDRTDRIENIENTGNPENLGNQENMAKNGIKNGIKNGTKNLSKNLILIPFKLKNPKTRLSGILNLEERKNLAILMLSDVLESIKGCDYVEEVVIAVPDEETATVCKAIDFRNSGVEVLVDERNLNDLVNHNIAKVVAGKKSLAVIMADLPLLNPSLVSEFLNSKGDVVLSPGRKGGTNMLLVRNQAFRVSYHYGSFTKHIEIAKSKNLSIGIFDSFFSSVDVDDESDVLELLIHGKGKRSWEYLKSLGFSINCEEKDPRIEIQK